MEFSASEATQGELQGEYIFPVSIESVLEGVDRYRLQQFVPLVHDTRAEEVLSHCRTTSGFKVVAVT